MSSDIVKCKIKLAKQLFPKGELKDGDFGIISAKVEEVINGEPKINNWGTITVKGKMCSLNYKDTYTLTGKEVNDPKYGLQYEILFVGKEYNLNTKEGQRTFLEVILTENQIDNLYKALDNPIEVIEKEDIETLCTVKGIGGKTAIKLIDKYQANKDYSYAYIELEKYGISVTAIKKLVDTYKSPEIAVAKIKENPYILIDEVEGIGWSRADEIALKGGIELHNDFRIMSFIKFFLKEQAQNGHSYVSPSEVMFVIEDKLGTIDEEKLKNILYFLKDNKTLWWNEDKTKIGLMQYFYLELNIKKELTRLLEGDNNFKYDNWEEIIKEEEEKQGWCYTDEQKKAILMALENQVCLISGLAGTGKTTVVNGILKILQKYSFKQTALAGKAVARMSETTGEEGFTIHRLLGYDGFKRKFIHNKDYPLETDIVVLDEISLIGGDLFYALIQAIQTNSKFIMLGDMGQLESIGALNIAKDIINSNKIPSVELTEVHRQAQKSAIITESKRIRFGEQIIENSFIGNDIRGELQDLELNIYKDANESAGMILEHFKEGIDLIKDIMEVQIVVPNKARGKISTYQINNLIQEIYNPRKRNKSEVIIGYEGTKYALRVGDKVINIKNNYKTTNELGDIIPVFNGHMGVIKEISEEEMIVNFPIVSEDDIIIPKEAWDSIQLGYACTGHKLQGSQAKYIIIGLDYSSYTLLSRQWVYTAITRAKEYCVLNAENGALKYAIAQDKVSEKRTFLRELLDGEII